MSARLAAGSRFPAKNGSRGKNQNKSGSIRLAWVLDHQRSHLIVLPRVKHDRRDERLAQRLDCSTFFLRMSLSDLGVFVGARQAAAADGANDMSGHNGKQTRRVHAQQTGSRRVGGVCKRT